MSPYLLFKIGVDPIDIVAAGATFTGQMVDLINFVRIIAIDEDEIAIRIGSEDIDPEFYLRFQSRRASKGFSRGVGTTVTNRQRQQACTTCINQDAQTRAHPAILPKQVFPSSHPNDQIRKR